MNLTRKIVVFGGNGFLGQKICQRAVQLNWDVTSVSISGKIHDETTQNNEEWIERVKWVEGDIFNPHTYRDLLADKTDVVHTIGILLENSNYKKWLNDPFSLLQPKNPLLRTITDEQMTYERWNTQSATTLALEFHSMLNKDTKPLCNTNGLGLRPSFTYISSDHSFPMIPKGYIDSKRRAERLLEKFNDKNYRVIIPRPGFMFDETTHDLRNVLAEALKLLDYPNKMILNRSTCLQPISTKKVAHIVCDKIASNQYNGTVKLTDML